MTTRLGRVRYGGTTAVALGVGLMMSACGGGAPAKSYGPDVWAVVDGREIRKADVEKAYNAMVPPTATPPAEEERLATELGVLDELITQDILAARALATGIVVAETDIDTAFTERRAGMSDEAMDQQLRQRNLTQDDVRQVLRRELLVQKLLERDVVEKVAVTDAEIGAYFDQNRAQFNLAEPQYHIAQIVVTPQRNPQTANRLNDDAGTPDEAQRKVAMLFERLRAGADFSSLATDYSEDPQSAAQGGDLGFIPESSLKQAPAELRALVLKMQPGNVNTIMVSGGYSIVLLVAKEPAGQRDLTMPAVKENIREGLRERKDRLLRAAYLAAARSGATVDNRLAKLVVAAEGKPLGPSLVTPPGK